MPGQTKYSCKQPRFVQRAVQGTNCGAHPGVGGPVADQFADLGRCQRTTHGWKQWWGLVDRYQQRTGQRDARDQRQYFAYSRGLDLSQRYSPQLQSHSADLNQCRSRYHTGAQSLHNQFDQFAICLNNRSGNPGASKFDTQ